MLFFQFKKINKVGQSAFRDFLKSEFCEENLDFWLACQEFKTLDGLDERQERPSHIYEEFIGSDSPSQVNIYKKTFRDDGRNRTVHRLLINSLQRKKCTFT